jgi:hypothetical protein
LNHGEKITAVGASDSHTVGEPVGQGRTYLRSSTDAPSEIDVGEACRALVEGRSTISLGLFCDVVVEERWSMGDLVPVTRGEVSLSLRVAAPSWVTPRKARVFVNGAQVAERNVAAAAGSPSDVRLEVAVPAPPHDAYLVCVVTGDGVEGAYWRTDKPYTLAATNPVYLDADGDGRYTSPRALATAIVEAHGTEPARLRPALARVDDAVAVEAMSIARADYERGAADLASLQRARARLAELAKDTRRGVLARYLEGLPPPEKVLEQSEKADR